MDCFQENLEIFAFSILGFLIFLIWGCYCFVKNLNYAGTHHYFIGSPFLIKIFYLLSIALCEIESILD